MAESETVVAVRGVWPGGEAELVEDGIHEVSGAIAGEGAASAVRSVSSGRETEDEDAGFGVAEAGDGTGPVGVVDVRAAAGLADGFAVGAEAGTTFAGDDGVASKGKGSRKDGRQSGQHKIKDTQRENAQESLAAEATDRHAGVIEESDDDQFRQALSVELQATGPQQFPAAQSPSAVTASP